MIEALVVDEFGAQFLISFENEESLQELISKTDLKVEIEVCELEVFHVEV